MQDNYIMQVTNVLTKYIFDIITAPESDIFYESCNIMWLC